MPKKLAVLGMTFLISTTTCFGGVIQDKQEKPISIATEVTSNFLEWEKINNSPVQIYRKTNFKEMRRGVEQLFGSSVDAKGGYGALYTIQEQQNGQIVDVSSNTPTFSGFMGTKVSLEYLEKSNMKDDLAEIASLSFSDVTGDEWYAYLIPLNVYYGTVNGYTDGTFKGTNVVSRAEFISMLCNAQNKAYPIQEAYVDGFGDAWYIKSLGALNHNTLTPEHLTKTTIMEGITRGECALILAQSFLPEKYNETLGKLNAGEELEPLFTDITGASSTLAEDYEARKIASTTQFYGAFLNKCKIKSKPPKDIYAAIHVLNQQGVFSGDHEGNSNWTHPITRAEVLALITKLEQTVNITQ